MDNQVRRRIWAGGVALGLIVRSFRSGEIAKIAQATGHDFLFIDTQHALFSRESVAEIITAALGYDIAPLVRVRSYEDPDASLYLDGGASGVIVPDVSTADQARHVVETCRYPPRGRRSLSGPPVRPELRHLSSQEAMERSNADTLIVCMIETTAGLQNVEEIAATEGVDALYVGCVDLLMALGMPDDPGCPEILDAIDRVGRAARRHGRILGVGGDRDPDRRARYIRGGARFLSTGTDVGILTEEAGRIVSSIREVHPS